jgi:hypothetical protein
MPATAMVWSRMTDGEPSWLRFTVACALGYSIRARDRGPHDERKRSSHLPFRGLSAGAQTLRTATVRHHAAPSRGRRRSYAFSSQQPTEKQPCQKLNIRVSELGKFPTSMAQAQPFQNANAGAHLKMRRYLQITRRGQSQTRPAARLQEQAQS